MHSVRLFLSKIPCKWPYKIAHSPDAQIECAACAGYPTAKISRFICENEIDAAAKIDKTSCLHDHQALGACNGQKIRYSNGDTSAADHGASGLSRNLRADAREARHVWTLVAVTRFTADLV